MQSYESRKKGWPGEQRLAVAGMLGASFVSVGCLLTVQSLGVSGRLSFCCFSIAIPLLCLAAWLHSEHSPQIAEVAGRAVGLTFLGGYLLAFGGFVCLFWHASWVFGVLFLLTSLCALALGTYFNIRAEELDELAVDHQPGTADLAASAAE